MTATILVLAVTSISEIAYGANEGTSKVEGTYSKAKSSELYTVEQKDKSSDGEINKSVPSSIASVLGYNTDGLEKYYLIFGEELSEYGMVIKTNNEEATQKYEDNMQSITDVNIKGLDVVDMSNSIVTKDVPKPEPKQAPVKKQNTQTTNQVPAKITNVDQSEALLHTDSPDENYTGAIVELSPEDRDLLERLVMGEAGGQGFEGAALVAQTIRDNIVYRGFKTVAEIRTSCKYTGSISRTPNDDVKRACAYVFDQGGIVVKHKIFYFYAFQYTTSRWHETQKFIVQHGGHRFFSTWK